MFEVIKCPGKICRVKKDQMEKNSENHILVYSSHLMLCEDKAFPTYGFEWFSDLDAKAKAMTA